MADITILFEKKKKNQNELENLIMDFKSSKHILELNLLPFIKKYFFLFF